MTTLSIPSSMEREKEEKEELPSFFIVVVVPRVVVMYPLPVGNLYLSC
jgi:hypothetical protein